MRTESLRWGILGTGGIASAFARALKTSETGRLAAAASRDPVRAERFASLHGAASAHGSYASLLADPTVDAVYVALPHTAHAEWSIRAAEAGKHILCEKPLALNRAEASAIVAAARENGVFLMEAFMYRCHPQTARLAEAIRSGAVGEVRLIQAAFGFFTQASPESRLLDPALGGGGILDAGCYPVSMARLLAGAALGKPFADPIEVSGAGVLGPTGVDAYAVASMRFEGGILATLTCGVSLATENNVRVVGTGGTLVVPSPWFGGREAGFSKLVLFKGGIPEEIVVESSKDLYAIEADHVAAHLAEKEAPAMPWADSLGNMAALDRWRACAGVEYPAERPERLAAPFGGRHPERGRANQVASGAIHGIGQPVSDLVLSVASSRSAPDLFALLDSFFEKGGNALCLSPIHDPRRTAGLLGQWLASRKNRNRLALFARGVPHALPTPALFHAALATRLQEIGTSWVDLFIADGDNPALPVEDFVAGLAAEVRAGRCKAYALGNWSLPRAKEAAAFAKANGLPGPSAVSAAFSLAIGEEATCPTCHQWATPGARAWLKSSQTPIVACICRATPFFRGLPDARCEALPEALLRREEVARLGAEKGVPPEMIGLAWVLQQPFPAFALVNPETPEELDALFAATRLKLSPAEIARLAGEG